MLIMLYWIQLNELAFSIFSPAPTLYAQFRSVKKQDHLYTISMHNKMRLNKETTQIMQFEVNSSEISFFQE